MIPSQSRLIELFDMHEVEFYYVKAVAIGRAHGKVLVVFTALAYHISTDKRSEDPVHTATSDPAFFLLFLKNHNSEFKKTEFFACSHLFTLQIWKKKYV
jgi:hypothetical protein